MSHLSASVFVRCSCGHLHWGRYGAAGLLLVDPARGVLLQRRAWWVHHGRTWALPGGAIEAGETAVGAAAREAFEEASVPADAFRAVAASVVDHGDWSYTTVLALADGAEARVANTESAEVRWVDPDDVPGYPLHRDFAAAWPDLRERVGQELVLVVDAANVVGSRPDGWWRDRHGAAERLRDQLAKLAEAGVPDPDDPAVTWWPRIVLVVEGKAKHVTGTPGVEVVAADTDGDSKIVEVVAQQKARVLVATADRELKRRVEALGASIIGPGTLRTQLDRL
ncbi:NTP pyrophosphohydrolase [Amycolatopsis mediterranei S699]|uniref:NTP pyrophosphohydrolase n=1 Tax=Amycolatopsis mediterranei (strain U-32) TaxID=749927 RepID=A0A0H3D044_AMYMU|nr:NUDIX domain-containing protein [Amycolatopsis mediterranei]ADJ44249.1 NTP pyrophosphohydrolase [Amycolatopsis mediterranei U32]AFO75963.1 NTP pyrophosphohydrolase [Amycolatopsis mediterranei S699]AGT83092.1 NTP pyrophosphohydrolase [Amycolatopsis mediterranei RB]KDO06834.1 ADP-ribose pyrophosphatase [Amycolatopsis mediterranei]KDU92256.1 ADP-ribose pyrophosphatase [Amycolatopsis mediterranei]